MIRSTFSGFTMAQHALLANQRAIDVVGQNISNINTEGYTRQRLDLASITPVGASKALTNIDTNVGQGVMMVEVIQVRDPYLDAQFRDQLTSVGTADAMDSILEQLGNVFDETDSVAIRAALNDVITQLTNVANPANASQESLDAVVRSSFEVLINNIHMNSEALDTVESDTVSLMEDSVVSNLNIILNDIAVMNENIRNSQVLGYPSLELLDERNLLLDELSQYIPIDVKYTENANKNIHADTLQVTMTDAAGNVYTLIDDSSHGSFEFEQYADGQYGVNFTDIAGTTTTDAVDVVEGVVKGNLDMLNKAGSFDGTDVNGINYYRGMLDAFANQIATVLNTLNGGAGNELFTTADGNVTGFTAENITISAAWKNGTLALKKSSDPLGGSTEYDNIHAMINALSNDSYGFTNALGNVVFTGTIQDAYDNLQNTQAIDRKSSSSILATQTTVLAQIADARDAVSGVNQDEEVMDLMRYQQSYNAAARMMTVMDELLDKLINGTGVVGR